ncbi:unnamed protein product, partial [Effrenium voratum]
PSLCSLAVAMQQFIGAAGGAQEGPSRTHTVLFNNFLLAIYAGNDFSVLAVVARPEALPVVTTAALRFKAMEVHAALSSGELGKHLQSVAGDSGQLRAEKAGVSFGPVKSTALRCQAANYTLSSCLGSESELEMRLPLPAASAAREVFAAALAKTYASLLEDALAQLGEDDRKKLRKLVIFDSRRELLAVAPSAPAAPEGWRELELLHAASRRQRELREPLTVWAWSSEVGVLCSLPWVFIGALLQGEGICPGSLRSAPELDAKTSSIKRASGSVIMAIFQDDQEVHWACSHWLFVELAGPKVLRGAVATLQRQPQDGETVLAVPELVTSEATLPPDQERSPLSVVKVAEPDVADKAQPTPGTPSQNTEGRTAAWVSFTVALQYTSGQKLGLSLDLSDEKYCIVRGVAPEGLAAAWNKTCAKDQVVGEWHRLQAVNGQQGSCQELLREMQSTIQSHGELELSFEAPVKFFVNIKKESEDLGMMLVAKKSFVGVNGVTGGGAIQDHNNSAPERKVAMLKTPGS